MSGHILEITIQRKRADHWPVVAEYSETGNFLSTRREGQLYLDLNDLRSQATPQDYGTMLGQSLFR